LVCFPPSPPLEVCAPPAQYYNHRPGIVCACVCWEETFEFILAAVTVAKRSGWQTVNEVDL